MSLTKEPLLCRDIQRALFTEYNKSGNIICYNIQNALAHETDVLVLRRSGVTLEFEVKVSYADFRADFRKTRKHHELAAGAVVGPQYFYYACAPGIIPVEKLPPYAGLVHVIRHYYLNSSKTVMLDTDRVQIIKPAPRLHREANPGIHERICRSLMYKAANF